VTTLQPRNSSVDHLNTPRLIADDQQRAVWRNDNTELFGEFVPDENSTGRNLRVSVDPVALLSKQGDQTWSDLYLRNCMNQSVVILGYCLFCFALSAVVMKFLRTTWVYFLVSATAPVMVLIGGDALWHGYLDVWSDIAFIVSWLIAFGCGLVYYVVIRSTRKRERDKE
jgi:hypothetical protein